MGGVIYFSNCDLSPGSPFDGCPSVCFHASDGNAGPLGFRALFTYCSCGRGKKPGPSETLCRAVDSKPCFALRRQRVAFPCDAI